MIYLIKNGIGTSIHLSSLKNFLVLNNCPVSECLQIKDFSIQFAGILGYQLIESTEKIQSCTLLEACQCILMQLPQKVTVCYVNQVEPRFR